MDLDTDFDALDQALTRTAARHVPPPLDPRRLRRRRLRLEIGPLVWLVFLVAALTAAAAVDRSWWLALGLGLLLVPAAIANLLARHREIAGLGTAEDLAAYERTYFAEQARRQRSSVLIEIVLAVALAIVAWQTGDAWRWLVPAVFGALAVGRALLVLPYVERANRDAGGDPPHGWTVHVLLLALFLLYPLLLLASAARSVWSFVSGRRGDRR